MVLIPLPEIFNEHCYLDKFSTINVNIMMCFNARFTFALAAAKVHSMTAEVNAQCT